MISQLVLEVYLTEAGNLILSEDEDHAGEINSEEDDV
jgi:hypothetical protein